jgi:hypothetical protein
MSPRFIQISSQGCISPEANLLFKSEFGFCLSAVSLEAPAGERAVPARNWTLGIFELSGIDLAFFVANFVGMKAGL